jgi:ATP synthase protein I
MGLSAGMGRASQVTTIALEFSVPALLGVGLDRWLQTMPVATISGVVLGFLLGMLQTLRLANEARGGSSPKGAQPRDDRTRGAGSEPTDKG